MKQHLQTGSSSDVAWVLSADRDANPNGASGEGDSTESNFDGCLRGCSLNRMLGSFAEMV